LKTQLSIEPVYSPRTGILFQCPQCGHALALHQPDPELPDRLLGTCEECKSWYLTNPRGTTLSPVHQPRTRLRLDVDSKASLALNHASQFRGS
jgi:hypothetical protein